MARGVVGRASRARDRIVIALLRRRKLGRGACGRALLLTLPEKKNRGQSSVEAALLLPTLGLVLALLIQPCCLAYTRALMLVAAGEGVRLCATASADERERLVDSFVRRRLAAIPDVAVFHEGGADGWEVSSEVSDDGRQATVTVKGHVRPLPLMGAAMAALLPSDGELAVLEVRMSEQVRPGWLEGGFDEWISQWS